MISKPENLAEILKDIQSLKGKQFDPIIKHIIIHSVLKYRGNYTFSCGGISQQLDIPLRTVQKKVLVLKQINLFIFSHYLDSNIKGVHPIPCYTFNRPALNSILTNAFKTLVNPTNESPALVNNIPTNAAPALDESPMNSTSVQLTPQLAPDMRCTNKEVQIKSTSNNIVPGTIINGPEEIRGIEHNWDDLKETVNNLNNKGLLNLKRPALLPKVEPALVPKEWLNDKPRWEINDSHVPEIHKKRAGFLVISSGSFQTQDLN